MEKFLNFPKKFENPDLAKKWAELKKIRDICNISIEEKRASKVIGSSLEASLTISLNKNNLNILKARNLDNTLRLNAAFTWGKDSKTYFFKDKFVYQVEDNKIAQGYPKFINQVFNGVPDNIDAVFTWGLDRKTYFFKGTQFYKYNDKKQEIEKYSWSISWNSKNLY